MDIEQSLDQMMHKQESQGAVDFQQQQSLIERIQQKQQLFKILKTKRSLSIIYNRKEKSLEELSRRFLKCLVKYDQKTVFLDKLTYQLGVERRRLYDIINILESLKLVSRQCKNKYIWNGFKTIYSRIRELSNSNSTDLIEFSNNCSSQPISGYRCLRKEKSLEILSIGFLRLFLRGQTQWSLEDAARTLSPTEQDESKLKTKIRRLYDIANVLKSIGLIKKIHIDRKASFKWVGEVGLEEFTKQIIDEQNFDEGNSLSSKDNSQQKKQIQQQKSIPIQESQKTIQQESQLGSQVDQNQNQENQRIDSIKLNQVVHYLMDVMIQKSKQLQMQSTQKKLHLTERDQNINQNLNFTSKIRQTLTIIQPVSKND